MVMWPGVQTPNNTADEANIVQYAVAIVESDPIISMDLHDKLEELGLEVHAVRNFQDAKNLIAAIPHIGVVIGDVDVPYGMNSGELAAVIAERATHLRVIVTDGDEMAISKILPKETVFFRKPFHMDRLVQHLLDK